MRLRRHFPSTRQGLNQAVESVMGMARRCGCAGDYEADLEIAVREALANAMIHGNAFQDSKRIFLRCYGAPTDALLILVRDEGNGFDPDEVPDPRTADRMQLQHGRGLLLMRTLMDYVEFRRQGRELSLIHISEPTRPY